jgi:hypothetical protein
MRKVVKLTTANRMDLKRLKKVELLRLNRRILDARKRTGYSDAGLAAECGFDKDYFCQIACGRHEVVFSELCEICEALCCDIATITKGIPYLLVAGSTRPGRADDRRDFPCVCDGHDSAEKPIPINGKTL